MRAVVAALIVATLGFGIWHTFRTSWHASFPPQNGLSPEGARALASRLASVDRVESTDLDVDFAPSWGSAELLIDGDQYYPRILADIEAARSSVHISEYEVGAGAIGDRFSSTLRAKRQQGVDVRVIVDSLGSSTGRKSKDYFDDLVQAGVLIVQNDALPLDRDGLLGGDQKIDWRLDELAHVDHRKLFVIDGRVAWVGSAGVADHFYDGRYHDVFVRLDGEAVSYLQTIFLTSFRFLGGPLPTSDAAFDGFYPPPATRGELPITVLHNVPREGHLATTDAMAHLIDNAVRRLDIVSPFTADRAMIERITAAARRGVQVRFVAPAYLDSLTGGAFEHYIPELQAAGVAVWLYPRFPHAKVVLADDRVLLGSTNLDAWALYRNWELGILVEDAAFAGLVRSRLFDVDVARSSPPDPPSSALVRARNWLFAALGPVI